MPLRKYQATSSRDANVYHTGEGFVFVRGGEAGPPIWPPPNPPPPPDPPCPDEGTVISTVLTSDFMYDAGCGPVLIGYTYTDTVADGECGTREETRNQCNVGDFATCNGQIYSSDAQCNVTSRPECPPDMTFIRGVSTDDIYYDAGCGPMTIGYHIVNIVADGNCGEKEDAYDQWNVGDVGTCNGYIYSVDDQGNVTSRPETPPPPPQCDEGYYWDESQGMCVPYQNTNCPTGEHWVEGIGCVPDEQPPPE